MKKQSVIAALSLAVAVTGTTMTAYADGWKHNQTGWWYEASSEPMGWYNNGWHWIDGNGDGTAESYYFAPDGYALTNTTTPDGYQVNADGAWIVDGVVQSRAVSEKRTDSMDWQNFSYEGVYYYMYESGDFNYNSVLTVTRKADGTFHFAAKHEDSDSAYFEADCQFGTYHESELESGDGTKEMYRTLDFQDANGDAVATYHFDSNSMAIWPGLELSYFSKG